MFFWGVFLHTSSEELYPLSLGSQRWLMLNRNNFVFCSRLAGLKWILILLLVFLMDRLVFVLRSRGLCEHDHRSRVSQRSAYQLFIGTMLTFLAVFRQTRMLWFRIYHKHHNASAPRKVQINLRSLQTILGLQKYIFDLFVVDCVPVLPQLVTHQFMEQVRDIPWYLVAVLSMPIANNPHRVLWAWRYFYCILICHLVGASDGVSLNAFFLFGLSQCSSTVVWLLGFRIGSQVMSSSTRISFCQCWADLLEARNLPINLIFFSSMDAGPIVRNIFRALLVIFCISLDSVTFDHAIAYSIVSVLVCRFKLTLA